MGGIDSPFKDVYLRKVKVRNKGEKKIKYARLIMELRGMNDGITNHMRGKIRV